MSRSDESTHYDGDGCPSSHGGVVAPREVRVVDPNTGGEKGQKPEQYSLIPVAPHAAEARVYGKGAQKYAPNNWRKGYAWSLSFDALMRHVNKARAGQWLDECEKDCPPDCTNHSGEPHLAHVKFHCNTLMEFERLGLGTDDRGDKC